MEDKKKDKGQRIKAQGERQKTEAGDQVSAVGKKEKEERIEDKGAIHGVDSFSGEFPCGRYIFPHLSCQRGDHPSICSVFSGNHATLGLPGIHLRGIS
jgi:hypothetical protein